VTSVAGRTGAVVIAAGDVTGLTAAASAAAPVQSVAGRTGAVVISTSDVSGYAAPPVTSVAGRTGAVVIAAGDVTGLTAAASAAAPVQSVAGRTGAVVISTSDVSGYAAPPVTSVAGRTGAVVIAAADVTSGILDTARLATGTADSTTYLRGDQTWATVSGGSTDASSLTTGTLADARLSANVAMAATVATMNHGSVTGIDTVPRNIVAAAYQGTSNNTIFWTFFTPQVTLTVGNISMCTGSIASTSLTAVIMALYTFDETTYTMVARTASDTTLFNATSTLYTKPFDTATGYPATYTLQKGVRYGVGLWMQGSTFPTLAGAAINPQVSTLSPRASGYRGSQPSIPTTGTVFTGNNTSQIWSRLT
jgi:hypothetical protein